MSTSDGATALKRFGLGARPGEAKRIGSDPRGFLLQSLAKSDAALISEAALPPSHVTLAAIMQARRARRLARAATKGGQVMSDAAPPPAAKDDMGAASASSGLASKQTMAGAQPHEMAAQPKPGRLRREAFLEEAAARFHHAITAEDGLVERLVMFWSNHFCISATKGAVAGIAGAYEREAIRPHVLGRFSDMLLAVEQHPAMLIYLDNAQSVGPRSVAGVNRGRGLNENLAREILELHTLGADAGYTQEDVTSFARILTGWTVGAPAAPVTEPGKFFFAPRRHEPGDQTVLGKRYRDQGQLTGIEVLRDLARHPATARHIAGKLARHFVADEAPPSLVDRLAATFRETDGDLARVSRTLLEAPEAWSAAAAKVVPPYDFVVAVARGLNLEPEARQLLRLTNQLGQPLWRPPSPAGWPDTDAAWAAPSALRERLRIAEMAAHLAAPDADPRAVADDVLGETMSTETRQAIARAETREQGLQLALMAPEFLRR